ncbi:MAG: nuclear transport factor 2 family protein, partial [Planctomycetota bacterium]
MTKTQPLIIAGLTLAVCFGFAGLAASQPDPLHQESEKAAAVDGAATLKVAEAFLKAAGMGDGATLRELMADDFVWHNEGDKRVPWIGTWEGPETVFGKFMPAFGAGLKATSWTTEYSFVSGDQAAFMGTMSGTLLNSGA